MKAIVTFFVLLFSITAKPNIVFAQVRSVYAIAVSGNDVYVGGDFGSAGIQGFPARGIAKWDGNKWDSLGSGVNYPIVAGADPVVRAIAVNGNDVYVGGQFVNAGNVAGTQSFAKWDGQNWSSVGGAHILGQGVAAIAVSGNDVYVGGNFELTTAGGDTIYNLAKWNGSSWSSFGLQPSGFIPFAITVSGSDLYVGGFFGMIGGISTNIAKWNGSSWSSLGSGLRGLSGSSIYAIAINDSGEVYVGGNFWTWEAAGGKDSLNYIAKWNGSSWDTTLGKGYGVGNNGPGLFSEVKAIVCKGNDVYVASTVITGEKYSQSISKWNGSSWVPSFGSGTNGSIYAMASSSNDLYVGGYFNHADGEYDFVNNKWISGISVDNIARWDGSNWHALVPLSSPAISLNQTPINFGNVNKDSTKSVTIKVRNSVLNSYALVIDSVYTKTRWFSATLQKDTLEYGDTSNIVVSFSPDTATTFVDTLYIVSNGTTPLIKIALKGELTPLQVIFFGATFDFGNIAVQDSSVQSLLLGNFFSTATTIDSIYTKTNNFSVTPQKKILNPQDTLNLVVTFKPKSFNTFTDTVILENRALASVLKINLKGQSPSPNLVLTTNQLEFGSVKQDSLVTKIIAITNSSINNLSIDSVFTLTERFSIVGNSTFQTVRRGDTLKVTISFSSSSVGTFSDTLYISNNSLNKVVKVFLSGIATPVLSVSDENSALPEEFALRQNYPNPFNPSTTINYQLPKNSLVTLKVFDVLGKEVAELVNEMKDAGYYDVKFDASKLSSGIYFYRITAESFIATKKLLLMK